ncbi:hypothetical protein ATY81_07970 [Rhizobium sp. R72]|nr:hypothetical protein ATY81_07970 [Rhizobium sp. R72]OWV97706.1 hypothetical protein ATY80_07970 [Rhizobium sp. R711]
MAIAKTKGAAPTASRAAGLAEATLMAPLRANKISGRAPPTTRTKRFEVISVAAPSKQKSFFQWRLCASSSRQFGWSCGLAQNELFVLSWSSILM